MVNFRGDSTKENNWKDVEGVAAEETFLLFRKNWMELSNLFSAIVVSANLTLQLLPHPFSTESKFKQCEN